MVLKRQNGSFFSLSVQNTVIGKHSPTLQKNGKFRTDEGHYGQKPQPHPETWLSLLPEADQWVQW